MGQGSGGTCYLLGRPAKEALRPAETTGELLRATPFG